MLDWHKQADEDTVSKALENNLTEVFRTKTNDDCSLVLLTANSRGNDRHDYCSLIYSAEFELGGFCATLFRFDPSDLPLQFWYASLQ